MARSTPTFVVAILLLAAVAPGGLAHPPSVLGDSPPPQTPRFPADAEVVTVDVVVLDDSGEPVEGLTVDDFTIVDEGQPRAVSRFEAVVLPESPAGEGSGPSLVSTNTSASHPSHRTFVVVFDDVHMGHTTARRARDAVREFLDTLRDGDWVSLVPTSGGGWWHARIPEGRHNVVGASRRLVGRRPRRQAADRMSDHEAMRLHLHHDPAVAAAVIRRGVQSGLFLQRPAKVGQYGWSHPFILARAAEVYYHLLSRRQATFAALQEVTEALQLTRGRKSILLLSEGFIQEPGLPEHQDLIRAAQRANVVVHFIDVRGLVGLPDSADVEMGPPTGGLLTDYFEVLDQMSLPLLDSLGAVSVAADTGGRVIKNQNDLARGLERLERESRTYYLLGFEPTDVEHDGGFREIEVTVGRPGIKILAREGYFAPSAEPETPPEDEDALDPQLRRALDSPLDADGIPLRMTSYVLGPADGKTTVLLVADVDPRGMTFEEQGDRYVDTLSFNLMASHRDSGERIHRGHQIELSLPPAAYEQLRRNRLPLMIDLPLAPGRHQARLVVRDEGSGLIGTVRHDIDVPAPETFRVSTPILSDMVNPVSGVDSPLRRPRPLARRTFVAGGMLTLHYEVHGAEAAQGTPPRVVSGFLVESASGLVVATGPVDELTPGPEGQIAQTAGISLDKVPAGVYALVVKARDQANGQAVETRFPFRVAPPPGTAVLEETVEEEENDDPLERVRGYLLGYGETRRE